MESSLGDDSSKKNRSIFKRKLLSSVLCFADPALKNIGGITIFKMRERKRERSAKL
jgi:hypothetical protein